jgi:hypothetical protein
MQLGEGVGVVPPQALDVKVSFVFPYFRLKFSPHISDFVSVVCLFAVLL